jgi:hypothetical protein
MRILTLPVDDSIADSYNNAAPNEKSRINSLVNMLLAKFLKEKENSTLFGIMKEMSDEAKNNGLTIEKLGELMDWDKETIKNLFGEDAFSSTNASPGNSLP